MDKCYYTQSADTLIIVNENFAPMSCYVGLTIQRDGLYAFNKPKTGFTLTTANPAGTLTASAVTGAIKLTASSSIFSSGLVDQFVNVTNGFGRARITKFVSATVVEAVTEIPS